MTWYPDLLIDRQNQDVVQPPGLIYEIYWDGEIEVADSVIMISDISTSKTIYKLNTPQDICHLIVY
jgi:hypothetical protein